MFLAGPSLAGGLVESALRSGIVTRPTDAATKRSRRNSRICCNGCAREIAVALDELMPLVYAELRRIAESFMRRQPPGHTLQPTALVNEAFIKLFGDASRPSPTAPTSSP